MVGSVTGIVGVLSLSELSREPTCGPDFPFYPSLVTVLVLHLQVCHWGNWKEGTSTRSRRADWAGRCSSPLPGS